MINHRPLNMDVRRDNVNVNETVLNYKPSMASGVPKSRVIDPGEDSKINEELEEIKAKTMFHMIEDITLKGSLKRVLFMTNAQARMFDNVKLLLDAFDFPRPQLVIMLMRSKHGIAYYKWRKKCNHSDTVTSVFDLRKSVQSDREITFFMENTILPMAVESNAVILVRLLEEDTLLTCLSNAVDNVRKRYGPRLPFTVLGIDTALHFIENCHKEKKNYTSLIVGSSSKWSKALKRINAFHMNNLDKTGYNYGFANLPEEVDNIIVVDGIDMPKTGEEDLCMVNFQPTEELVQNILFHYASTIPSLALQTDRLTHTCVPYLQFGVPTIYIDTRMRRRISANKDPAVRIKEGMENFSNHLKEIWNMRDQTKKLDPIPVDNLNALTMAYFHDILKGDGNYGLLTKLDWSAEETQLDELESSHGNLIPWLYIALKNSSDTEDTDPKDSPSHEEVCKVVDLIVKSEMLYKYLRDHRNEVTSRCEVEGGSWYPITDIDSLVPPALSDDHKRNIRWRNIYTTITHPKFYSGNVVMNPLGLKEIVGEISRAGRLPKYNTRAGLLLLRSAWNVVDICTLVSWRYKLATKVLYILILCFGITLTCLTVLKAEGVTKDLYGHGLIFILTVASTFVASIMTFKNPIHRWKNLREAAHRMESNIWLYRTKVGRFAMPKYVSGGNMADKALSEAIKEVRMRLIEVGDVKNTAFNKEYPASTYQHGQYEPPANIYWERWFESLSAVVPTDFEAQLGDIVDNHQSPVDPNRYIIFRIEKVMKFYKGRLPRYNRFHNLAHYTILAAGGVGSCISFYGYTAYIAIIAIVMTSLTAYIEFSSTSNKLSRYNSAIIALKEVLEWWDTLSDVSKADLKNITELVESSERIISGEFQAWLSHTPKVNTGTQDYHSSTANKEKSNLEGRNNHHDDTNAKGMISAKGAGVHVYNR